MDGRDTDTPLSCPNGEGDGGIYFYLEEGRDREVILLLLGGRGECEGHPFLPLEGKSV
jgi:hypothetical protein